ncbi:TIGR01244 family sulfur transferase [Azospirillum halopraeferens]|uniref:TIGR01244 family sulfur transferase n=1 Tax=Azospirillum halopraeferens TaxID=34010 RepID=UPI0003F7B6A6|nr:TIGR01244 family sulfur transferase [Azospirillum halopraeferens]
MPTLARVEDNVYVCGQLQEADFADLARQGVKTIVNNRPDGEEATQLPHARAAELAAQHGLEYHFIPVGRDPLTLEMVDRFADILAQSPRPVVAYCRSGARSSTLHSYARARRLEQR